MNLDTQINKKVLPHDFPVSSLSYSQLIDNASKGDQLAYVELFERSKRIAACNNPYSFKDDDKEDWMNAAFKKAMDSLEKLENAEQYEAWFKKILGSCAKDKLRSMKRNREIASYDAFDIEDGEFLDRYVDPNHTYEPERHLYQFEFTRELHKMVDALPEKQRYVINSYYFENKKKCDIANQLGVSESAVRARVKKGLSALRKMIIDKGEDCHLSA